MRRNAMVAAVIAMAASTVGAQSAPIMQPRGVDVGFANTVLVVPRGEVRCLTCGELLIHGEGGTIALHEFMDGGGSLANAKPRRAPIAEVFISVRNEPGNLEADESLRACGGTSECHTDAREGYCHQACSGGGSEALAEVVQEVLRRQDARGLRALIAAEKGVVRVNVERSAVQILGCNETVAHHMPMSAPLLAQLNVATMSDRWVD